MFVSIIPGSDISVLPQHSERLGVLFGGGLSSLPSYCFEFFSLWEQSQLIGPHASCRFSLPIWLLYHILLFPADEGRSCSFMQVLTLHGVILNFSVRFHVAAAQTHSAVSAVFRLSRRLRLASLQPLRCCSVNTTGLRLPWSKSNFFQTTIRIEIKMWKAWTVIKRETPFNCV